MYASIKRKVHLLEEDVPAWIAVQVAEQGVELQGEHPRIAIRMGTLKPVERSAPLAPEGVDARHRETRKGLVLDNIERLLRLGRMTASELDQRRPDEAVFLRRRALEVSRSSFWISLEHRQRA